MISQGSDAGLRCDNHVRDDSNYIDCIAAAGDWSIVSGNPASARAEFDQAIWADEESFSVYASHSRPDSFLVSFPNCAEFELDFSKRLIGLTEAANATTGTIRHLLADQVVPRIIAHQGRLVLHAAGVLSSKGMVLFLGVGGSGKSTIALSLSKSGYILAGDDAIVVEIGDEVRAHAVYRSLRLFPDSIAELLDRSARHSPVASYSTKRNIEQHGSAASQDATRIEAAFLLDGASGDDVHIDQMSAGEACITLVEHSFWLDPNDIPHTKLRMSQASAVATQVPTFRLRFPRDYARLPRIHSAIASILPGSGTSET